MVFSPNGVEWAPTSKGIDQGDHFFVIQNLSELEHSVVYDWKVHHKDGPEGKSLHWAFMSKGIEPLSGEPKL